MFECRSGKRCAVDRGFRGAEDATFRYRRLAGPVARPSTAESKRDYRWEADLTFLIRGRFLERRI